MKEYLPPVTLPWSRKIERRHSPTGNYSTFKPCLCWEFGFSCSFCLLHEIDLVRVGAKGWSLMQVEHFIPQSKDDSQRNNYKNCLYICERCNKSRGDRPNQDDEGNTLLDPCSYAWADHFERRGDRISPRSGDGNAYYTWESYDLDDPSKVELRWRRRHCMELCADALLELSEFVLQLNQRAYDEADEASPDETGRKLEAAQHLHRARVSLLELLAEYRPIPDRSDTACSCGNTGHNSLAEVLVEQTVDLSDLLEQARARRPPL
jgi:hypothetical protein